MLNHLRQRVTEALASTQFATLSTYGAAALQATQLPCEAVGLHLYLLLPATSDHLLNLESQPEVVVTTTDWQLRGTAVILTPASYPPNLDLLHRTEAQWSRLLQIRPAQFNIRRASGWGFSETIDIEGQ
ncbi:MAG: hypothetical protein H6658_12020 [Ardenticatenaceae bacterium]|nr:hypothetical protein [Ardenticatenaceae bacterium]